MGKNAIFRMYSMTKAITGVAAMILFEEGYFFINDPVSKFLPEFGGLEVAVEKKDPRRASGFTTLSRRIVTSRFRI